MWVVQVEFRAVFLWECRVRGSGTAESCHSKLPEPRAGTYAGTPAAAQGHRSLLHSPALPKNRGSTFPRWKRWLGRTPDLQTKARTLLRRARAGGSASARLKRNRSPQAEHPGTWDIPLTTKNFGAVFPASLRHRW